MAVNLKEMKEKLAYSCNILANEGHWDNILGHVSVRIPGQNRILMKPHSFGFEEIRPQHIIVVDLDTGTERQLTNLSPTFNVREFDVSDDGREIVVERVQEQSDVVLIELERD